MIDKNFFKFDDDKLKLLLKNKNNLVNVDKKLDEKIINGFKNQKFDKELKDKKVKTVHFKKFLAPAVVVSMASLFAFLIYYNTVKSDYLNINSFEYIKNGKNITDEYLKSSNLRKKAKKNFHIKSDAQSTVKLTFEKNINLNLCGNSELTLKKIIKNKKSINVEFIMSKGELFCDLKLPSAKSSFSISTDQAKFTVAGTSFNIKIFENKDIKLDVMEGIVQVMSFIKSTEDYRSVKKNYKSLYDRILSIENRTIKIEKDQSIILKHDKLENIKNILNALVKNLNNDLEQNKLLTDENKLFYDRKIDELFSRFNEMLLIKNNSSETENTNEKNKELIKIINMKLIGMNNIDLSELSTAVTYDDENIYVTSDKNKAVYCINAKNGNLLWKFNNAGITKLNSSTIPYDNGIFIPSIDKLFILDKNGNLLKTENLKNNPVFWSSSIIFKNSLLIPSLNSIYCYKNNQLSVYDENIHLNGQIYISAYDKDLFLNALNDKTLSVYDSFNNKLNAYTHKFEDRSFNSPVYDGGYIYISGINKTVYKYKNNDFTAEPEKIRLENGVVSNLISYNKYLYFIDDKGYFNKMNSTDLMLTEKKAHVENSPSIDKFLTKKLFYYNDFIYFTSDKAEIFCFDLINDKYQFLKNNFKELQFIGNPAVCNNEIYVIDIKGNLFRIYK